MSILIKNALLDNGRMCNILIEGDRISSVTAIDGEESSLVNADGTSLDWVTLIDAKGMRAISPFVNMHTHAGMTLFRGLSEDMPLERWLADIWEGERYLDRESIYWGTKLALLEMIKSGTATFADMYWEPDVAAKAVVESGIRGAISYCFLDGGDKEKAARQRDECVQMYESLKGCSPLVSFVVSIHAHYTVCDENMLWAADFARKNGLKLHTHLSETRKENTDHFEKYGISPTRRLYEMGILGNDLIAAHSLWLDDNDIELYGRCGVTAVHNINSNLKLSSGYRFRYNELRDAGANVTIGTDGCGSSNSLDMLEAMKFAALTQKAWREDPSAMPVDQIYQIATVNGSKALGIDNGRIAPGAKGDVLLIDTRSTRFIPNYDFMANLIYSANSSCVDTMICNGHVVMQGGKVEGEEQILAKASEHVEKFVKKIKKR